MNTLEIGKPLDIIAGKPEGVYFDAGETGYTLILNFNNPTEQEINAVRQEQSFEIRETVINNAMWITAKCGSLEWVDAPYNPHLSAHIDKLVKPDNGLGTALMLIMTDARTGIIKHMRLIGLGVRFSERIYQDIMDLKDKLFSHASYDAALMQTMRSYTTHDIVKISRNYWKLR